MTREEAKREMLFAKREVMADSWIDKAYDVAISALEQPEIIHCRDCKHWRQQTNYDRVPLPFGFCESYEVDYINTDDEFYCGHAERREEGGK